MIRLGKLEIADITILKCLKTWAPSQKVELGQVD